MSKHKLAGWKTRCFFSLLSFFLFTSCSKNNNDSGPEILFDSIPVSKPVIPVVVEISGIADSKINQGYIWAHEDSGTPSQVYLINHNGQVVKTMFLQNTSNRDWEDMALVDGQIYIGETGDNSQVYPDYLFYKFPEPSLMTDTIKNIETIRYSYPDGSHDAEAFIVDPATKDIFIITKRDNPSRIYKLSFPYAATNILTLAGSLDYSGVVSATISPDGGEIIIKTYTELFYYNRSSSETIAQALQDDKKLLKHVVEPQGEAICLAADHSGFYTLSEKGFASFVNLNFYRRK